MTFIEFCRINRIKWFCLCTGSFKNPYCIYKNEKKDIEKAHDLLRRVSKQLRQKAIKSNQYEDTLRVMSANCIRIKPFIPTKENGHDVFAKAIHFENLKMDLIKLSNAIDLYLMGL